MTIYSFWIFDRHCECIYHKDFKRPQRVLRPPTLASTTGDTKENAQQQQKRVVSSGGPPKGTGPLTVDDEAKLVFGVVFSLRNMVTKLAGDRESFFAFKTSKYKLHFFETQTNLRFVMVTDVRVEGIRPILEQIYAGLYVEYVVKNPLSPPEHPGGEGVNNELFSLGLDRFLTPLEIFE
ncbi:Longin-like domain-containing protein [Myxozyma melibiosi]|uniref:Trafficking protein particle complex subunit n=1 Tax=Myxozyma melibiosi TaxID=54550 RepID=A0ABR1F3Y1_9ASCO